MNESSLNLADVIDAQIRCAEDLITILEQEQAALSERSPESLDALEAACSAKSAAAQQLQRLGDRLQILAGPRRSGAEFEAWLAQHHGAEALIAAWRQLTTLARSLSDANRRNGALLDVREQQVRGALIAMAPEAPATYGRSGLRPSLPQGRVFSRA